jgi:hypothetical protein
MDSACSVIFKNIYGVWGKFQMPYFALFPPMSNEKVSTTRIENGILSVSSVARKKIQERIIREIELNGWGSFIFSVIVPTERCTRSETARKSCRRNLPARLYW